MKGPPVRSWIACGVAFLALVTLGRLSILNEVTGWLALLWAVWLMLLSARALAALFRLRGNG